MSDKELRKQLEEVIIDKHKEIERLNNIIKEVRKWIRIVQTNEDKKHLEPIINTDELDHILEILDKGE